MNLSVIIVSYKSDHLLESIIKKFSLKHEIIVVENSLQINTKKKIENKFKNSKVFSCGSISFTRCINDPHVTILLTRCVFALVVTCWKTISLGVKITAITYCSSYYSCLKSVAIKPSNIVVY